MSRVIRDSTVNALGSLGLGWKTRVGQLIFPAIVLEVYFLKKTRSIYLFAAPWW